MSKRVEEQLKSWGKQEEAVPEFFTKGIDHTLDNLPVLHSLSEVPIKRKNRKVAKVIVSTAAAITIGVVGSGFVSPAMANVLKEVPLLGSIFGGSSDPSIQLVEEKGLASKFNETITNNGVSFTINEAYFGGGRLIIGYTIDTDKVELETIEKSKSVPLHFEAKLDGERFTFRADFEQMAKNGVANGIIDMKVGLKTKLSKDPTLHLDVYEISGVDGSWNFKLPVTNKDANAATVTYSPMVTTQWEDATFVFEKAEFTPASSQIIIDRTVPKDAMLHYHFAFFDENGNLIPFEGGSGSTVIDQGNGMINFKDTIILEGREIAPKGLTVEIFNNHGEVYDPSNTEEIKVPLNNTKFPYTISYPHNGELVITNFEQLKDKTIVYYDIKGSLGLQNTFLMLEDREGERFTPESNGIRTNQDQLSFKREFSKTTGPIILTATVDNTTNVDKKVIEIDFDK